MPRTVPRLVLATYLATAAVPLVAAPRPRTVVPQVRGTSRITPAVPAGVWRRFTALWSAIGCGIDPNGVKCSPSTNGTPPTAVTPTTSGEIGAIIDPDG
jgi:hypothetical protein